MSSSLKPLFILGWNGCLLGCDSNSCSWYSAALIICMVNCEVLVQQWLC